MPIHGVLEIFVKTTKGKHKVGATFEDNDDNVVYISKIFPEAMMEFVNSPGDAINVAQYNVNTIEKRINEFKSAFANVNGSILAKLDAILQFIKNNEEIYEGIKVYI